MNYLRGNYNAKNLNFSLENALPKSNDNYCTSGMDSTYEFTPKQFNRETTREPMDEQIERIPD